MQHARVKGRRAKSPKAKIRGAKVKRRKPERFQRSEVADPRSKSKGRRSKVKGRKPAYCQRSKVRSQSSKNQVEREKRVLTFELRTRPERTPEVPNTTERICTPPPAFPENRFNRAMTAIMACALRTTHGMRRRGARQRQDADAHPPKASRQLAARLSRGASTRTRAWDPG